MRSIRLSLLFYFFVLLTAGLAGVSWFSYRTAAQALQERNAESHKLIEAQFKTQSDGARAVLDERLLAKAHEILSRSKSMYVYAQGYLSHLGILGAASMPANYYLIPVWAEQYHYKEGRPTELTREVFKLQSLHTYVDEEELLAPEPGEPKEFFQIYRRDGSTSQRSWSMEDHTFVLGDPAKKESKYFDDVELQPGTKVRRVTIKAAVHEWSTIRMDYYFSRLTQQVFVPKAPAKGKAPRPPQVFQPRTAFSVTAPIIFIQYASESSATEAKIAEFQALRDRQLGELEYGIERDLEELRSRMLWISIVTLLAIWLGGFGVIQLGLAPLAKLSDAVSKVSTKNFVLPLDTARLPHELQPIAGRLREAFDNLQRAFAREKQSAADISHELRTPLAALMTTLEVGLRKQRNADEYREILAECHASGSHMYQLVERILTLARLDAGSDQYRPDEVDVVDLAQSCADMIRPLVKDKGPELRVRLPESIIMQTDPDKLREVLVNLLHNAIEYNKPDGAIELLGERSDGKVRFEVRDTGIGISPEGMEHIFERFYRGDPSRHADTPHAGLGLSIVKCYVELMNGTIKVQSSPAGTKFTIELPFIAPKARLETSIKQAAALPG